jgi:TfoX/Sxy family transcriptional regulator of competence genes
MLNLLRTLLERYTPQPPDPLLEQRLAWAIEQIDPRLKSFGNYPHAYLPAITAASRYAARLAAALPDCLDLRPDHYAQEPQLHALFGDVAAITSSMRESSAITAYCAEQGVPPGGELFALMGMRRHEKSVFGTVVDGDTLLQGVQQTLVYFDSHTLTLPAASREELQARIETDLFQSLIYSLRAVIAEGARQKQKLETEREILTSRLRRHTAEREALAAQLQQVQQQLEPLSREWALASYPEHFNRFMQQPEHHLRLEECDMPIDMRGVLRESKGRLAGHFTFYDLHGRDRRIWTLCPVRLHVASLQQAMGGRSDKERWMAI